MKKLATVVAICVLALLAFEGQRVAAQPLNLRDHYKVYETLGPDGPAVSLVDQFDIRCVGGTNDGAVCVDNSECPGGICSILPENLPALGPLVLFGNPVVKNCDLCDPGFINNPDEHLTFHRIPEGQFGPTVVGVFNQFGPQTLTVRNPALLALPSEKAIQPNPLPTPAAFFSINHYKCYDAQGDAPNIAVELNDQFDDALARIENVTVGPPTLFCNPVDKNGEGTILDPAAHLTCYRIADTAPSFNLNVRNQFGENPLTTGNPVALCVPSLKLSVTAPTPAPPCPTPEPTATPTPVRHFGCYEIHRPSLNLEGVLLNDRFGPSTATIKRAKRLCAPADKYGEDPSAPLDPRHLTFYTIKQTSPPFNRVRGVTVTNQFGALLVDVVKPDRLLVPTAKSLIGPPPPLPNPTDHFKCYKVKARFRLPGIDVETQFGPTTIDIKRPRHLCVPVDKNGEGVIDPDAHLMCYKVRGPRPDVQPTVFTDNQFGTDSYEIFGPRELCVPSSIPCGNGVVEPDEQCDPPDFQGQCGAGQVCNASCECESLSTFCAETTPVSTCSSPPFWQGSTCDSDAECPGGCTAPAAALGRFCTANAQCGVCTAGTVGAGCRVDADCGPGGTCNTAGGVCKTGSCNVTGFHRGFQRPLQGGWDAINQLDEPAFGTLGSFPRKDSDESPVMLSNNHVFARSSSDRGPVAKLGERIDQPTAVTGVAPVAAGTLLDYELLCVGPRICTAPPASVNQPCAANAQCDNPAGAGNGVCGPPSLVCTEPAGLAGKQCTVDGDCDVPALAGNGRCGCAGGAQNQLNAVGANCIDAAIASPGDCTGDILDVGTPAPFTPTVCQNPGIKQGMPCIIDAQCDTPPVGGDGVCGAPGGTCPTILTNQIRSFGGVLVGRIVKKSGARTGLTCGIVRAVNAAPAFSYGTGIVTFAPVQFRISALGLCTQPAASAGLACTTNASCDNPAGANNGACTNPAFDVCSAPAASIGNPCGRDADCNNGGNGVCGANNSCTAPAASAGFPCVMNRECDDPANGKCGLFSLNANFGCGGDSGSLIVGVATNEPMSLLFAGAPGSVSQACFGVPPGASTTLANPIDLVLRRFELHF